MALTTVRNALISVSDKQGLPALATTLLNLSNTNIFSTGGTYNMLQSSVPSTNLHKVSDLTSFPEILNGRVKTLHPKIYGGILARRHNENDITTLSSHEIPTRRSSNQRTLIFSAARAA